MATKINARGLTGRDYFVRCVVFSTYHCAIDNQVVVSSAGAWMELGESIQQYPFPKAWDILKFAVIRLR